MKYLFLFGLCSVLIVSCSSTKPLSTGDKEGASDTQIIEGIATLELYSKDKADTVQSSVEYMFYETPLLPYQDSVNRIIKEYLSGFVSAGGGITEQNADVSVAFIENSLKDFGDEYNRQQEIIEGMGVWTTETSISIIEGTADFVEISFHNWNYSGGAHGNAWSEQRIIDRKTGKELMLEDFISDMSVLTAKAEKIFRADQEIAEGASLIDEGFWFNDGKFHLNENFVFNEETLDFLYNQYEIAPYAAGVIYLSIPMEEVKDLLKRKVR